MAEAEAAAADTGSGGMPKGDVDFLIACLKNVNNGAISINTKAVASELNYANPRSVTNRLNILKKKYNLPFGNASAARMVSAGADGGEGPASPSTPSPSKNKVVKKSTPAKSKLSATARKAVAEVVTKEEESGDDEKAEDADIDTEEKMEVESADEGDADEDDA